MIDDSDGDFVLLLAPGGIAGVFFLVAAVVIYIIAAGNQDECESKQCRTGSAKLIDHECLCVERAP